MLGLLAEVVPALLAPRPAAQRMIGRPNLTPGAQGPLRLRDRDPQVEVRTSRLHCTLRRLRCGIVSRPSPPLRLRMIWPILGLLRRHLDRGKLMMFTSINDYSSYHLFFFLLPTVVDREPWRWVTRLLSTMNNQQFHLFSLIHLLLIIQLFCFCLIYLPRKGKTWNFFL